MSKDKNTYESENEKMKYYLLRDCAEKYVDDMFASMNNLAELQARADAVWGPNIVYVEPISANEFYTFEAEDGQWSKAFCRYAARTMTEEAYRCWYDWILDYSEACKE